MKYLDYSRLEAFIERFFGSPASVTARLVGSPRSHDSGYIDIARFYGDGAIRPGEVPIEYLPNAFKFDDPTIATFARKTAQRFWDEGRLHGGPPVMAVADVDLESPPWRMVVQACSYEDQAGSSFALDVKDGLFSNHGGTLREYYKRRYPSPKLADNPLALCLGVCALVLTEKNTKKRALAVRRSRRLASLEDTIGPSVAGSVDYATGYADLHQLILGALEQEISEEIGLCGDEVSIVPLAYAREIFRGERPQLFCLVKTGLSEEAISERIRKLSPSGREHIEHAFFEMGTYGRARPKVLQNFNHEAQMSYYLTEEYLNTKV